jgi:hypothetical protein
LLQILEPQILAAEPDGRKNERLYPAGRPATAPAKSTHDAGHDAPWKRIVVAVHLIISAAYSALAYMATSAARVSLLYDIRNVDIGERKGMQVAAFVRPQALLPSCGAQHADETMALSRAFPQHFRGAADAPKRILFLNVDRGPDENMAFFETVYANVVMFLRMGLGLLVVASRAAGHSSANWHEQVQSYIRKATEAAMYSCEQYGVPRFKANKEPASDADRSLMRDNLFFECEQIALSITHQTAYGNPVAAVVGMGHDEHLGSAALSEHRAARNAASTAASESGRKSTGTSKVPGCSCRPDGQRGGGACSSAACKSCGAQGRPCTLFCACMGKCANPHNTMVLPGGKRLDELNKMYLDDVVALLNPTDIERFSVRHVIRTKYCLQVSTPSASSDRV